MSGTTKREKKRRVMDRSDAARRGKRVKQVAGGSWTELRCVYMRTEAVMG